MAIDRYIGIDFGTSTTVTRIKRYNNGRPVGERLFTSFVKFSGSNANQENGRPSVADSTVPTVISKSGNGHYFGYEAESKRKKDDIQYRGFKVDLGSEIPQLREQARELTREYFRFLYSKYSSQSEGGHLGDPDDIEHTIISYPVKWDQETREFMLQAARDAKFKNVEGMDEAQAAIYAVAVQNENQMKQKGYLSAGRASNILLIDMGAGTTDLVLCKYTPGSTPDIVCTWPVGGEVLFGGQEMDKILRLYIESLLDKDHPKKYDIIERLSRTAHIKVWKEMMVSPTLLNHDYVEMFSELDNLAGPDGVRDFKLDRTELETIARSYLSQFPQLVNGCLNEASKKGVRRGDIDLVILTGGHSQWYFVKEMLLDKALIDLPKIREDRGRILDTAPPQETVALGMVFSPIAKSFNTRPKSSVRTGSSAKVGETVRIGNFLFVKKSNGYALKHYGGFSEKVVIPERVKGESVIGIEPRAFIRAVCECARGKGWIKDNDKIFFEALYNSEKYPGVLGNGITKQIVFPPMCEYIGNEACYECVCLESITLPDGLKSIGDSAFEYTSLKEVTIPGTCKVIGNGAFYVSKLEKVVIENGVEKIGKHAFSGNELSEVIIPTSCKSIGDSAFTDQFDIGVEESDDFFDVIDKVHRHSAKLIIKEEPIKDDSDKVPDGFDDGNSWQW